MNERFIHNKQIIQAIQLRPMLKEDVSQVAVLHSLVFPDYFLTHMGLPFLIRFYSHFLQRPGVAVVALDGEKCVGYVAGMSQQELFLSEFYRKNLLPLTITAAQRFLADPVIRKEIYKRAGRIRAVAKTVFRKRNSYSSSDQVSLAELSADLLGIGVLPTYRGLGIADALVSRFSKLLVEEGVRTITLTVFNNNSRAIRFYEKTGWNVIRSEGNRVQFSRTTD
jgi:ribosomal protein S18 acetylase RimI-like enzyme